MHRSGQPLGAQRDAGRRAGSGALLRRGDGHREGDVRGHQSLPGTCRRLGRGLGHDRRPTRSPSPNPGYCLVDTSYSAVPVATARQRVRDPGASDGSGLHWGVRPPTPREPHGDGGRGPVTAHRATSSRCTCRLRVRADCRGIVSPAAPTVVHRVHRSGDRLQPSSRWRRLGDHASTRGRRPCHRGRRSGKFATELPAGWPGSPTAARPTS